MKIRVKEGIPADLDLGTVRPGLYEVVKVTGRGEARNSIPEPAYLLDNITVSVKRVELYITRGEAEYIEDELADITVKTEEKPMTSQTINSNNYKIYPAILLAMAEIGCIAKNNKNPQQGYSFRGIDDVLNSLQPALIKAKIFIVPRIVSMERQERASKSGGVLIYTTVRGEYDFVSAEDGSKVTASTYGEGMDSSDKSTNKAMSAALKYAVIQTLAIPTKELIDSETEHPEPSKKENPSPKPPKTEAPPTTAPSAPAQETGLPKDAATDKQRKTLYAKGMEQWGDKMRSAMFMTWLKEQGGFDYFTKSYASECIDDFAARAGDFEADLISKDNDKFPV